MTGIELRTGSVHITIMVKTDSAIANRSNNYQVKKKRNLSVYILKKEYLCARFIYQMV